MSRANRQLLSALAANLSAQGSRFSHSGLGRMSAGGLGRCPQLAAISQMDDDDLVATVGDALHNDQPAVIDVARELAKLSRSDFALAGEPAARLMVAIGEGIGQASMSGMNLSGFARQHYGMGHLSSWFSSLVRAVAPVAAPILSLVAPEVGIPLTLATRALFPAQQQAAQGAPTDAAPATTTAPTTPPATTPPAASAPAISPAMMIALGVAAVALLGRRR